jgi:hypothetical protein
MTDLDRESIAAVDALVYRLKNREPGTDDEPFAQEFITALRGRGWRPTEARTPWDFRQLPAGDGPRASEETRRQLEEARSVAAAAVARQRAEGRSAGAA